MQGINLYRVRISYLAPVMPQMAEKAWRFLNISFAEWDFVDTPLLDHAINAYEPLATRLDPKIVAQLVATPSAAPPPPPQKTADRKARPVTDKPAAAPANAPGFATINDFAK